MRRGFRGFYGFACCRWHFFVAACVLLVPLGLLYESPGGNLVDGLPPAASQIWGVKSRKSQNLAKAFEIYILKAAESEYPHARFLRACFGVSEVEFVAKFR